MRLGQKPFLRSLNETWSAIRKCLHFKPSERPLSYSIIWIEISHYAERDISWHFRTFLYYHFDVHMNLYKSYSKCLLFTCTGCETYFTTSTLSLRYQLILKRCFLFLFYQHALHVLLLPHRTTTLSLVSLRIQRLMCRKQDFGLSPKLSV